MAKIPFLLIGDAPHGPTGLSRILTDLLHLIVEAYGDRLDVGVCGYHYDWDLPKAGVTLGNEDPNTRMALQYRQWAFSDISRWGAEAITSAYRSFYGDRRGILFSIWDPARCYELSQLNLPVERWGYFAIDAANVNGEISGPAKAAVASYERVLAYSQYGANVLTKTLGIHEDLAFDHLPHGLTLETFDRSTRTTEEVEAGIRTLFPAGLPDPAPMVIGCVATNQPRKDLGVYFRALGLLRQQGLNIHGWLHTDQLITEAWSIPQLIQDCGMEDHVTVTMRRTDRQLAILYSLCVATFAPGRGEGFGYPIVESLAAGTPVVHADFAAGPEFMPSAWLVKAPGELHMEGAYGLLRPMLNPADVAFKLAGIATQAEDHHDYSEYCRDYIAHLDWPTLWPEWKNWIDAGLPAEGA